MPARAGCCARSRTTSRKAAAGAGSHQASDGAFPRCCPRQGTGHAHDPAGSSRLRGEGAASQRGGSIELQASLARCRASSRRSRSPSALMHADERENQTAGAGRGLLGIGDRGVDLADPAGEVSGRLRLDVGRTAAASAGSGSRAAWSTSLDVALEHHVHLARGDDQARRAPRRSRRCRSRPPGRRRWPRPGRARRPGRYPPFAVRKHSRSRGLLRVGQRNQVVEGRVRGLGRAGVVRDAVRWEPWYPDRRWRADEAGGRGRARGEHGGHRRAGHPGALRHGARAA